MYRFVLSRRWIGFALFVAVLGLVCVRLGIWQLDRLHERLANNLVVTTNEAAQPAPVTAVAPLGTQVSPAQQWRRVTATGTYDVAHQILLKYQTHGSSQGVNVVTPLVETGGTIVLVDRGWTPSVNNPTHAPSVPAPSTGQVTVTGWLQPDSTAGSDAVVPHDGMVRAISAASIAPTLAASPGRVTDGYVQMLSQSPSPAAPLLGPSKPELGQGPHLFYALQWFFFAMLAICGWFYFAWTEAHPRTGPKRARFGADKEDYDDVESGTNGNHQPDPVGRGDPASITR
ncbi:MAG: SURF1 family cytochrome oxidase biogenesis protein [Nocardioidaceae bacterium]